MQTKENRKPVWYKRKFLNNYNIQSVFIIYAVSMGFLFLSLGLVLSSSFERVITIQISGSGALGRIDYLLIGLLTLLIFFIGYMGVIISNRFVGPIFRLARQMEEFGENGNLDEVQFRKTDNFKEVAVAYNKMVTRLKELETSSKISKK